MSPDKLEAVWKTFDSRMKQAPGRKRSIRGCHYYPRVVGFYLLCLLHAVGGFTTGISSALLQPSNKDRFSRGQMMGDTTKHLLSWHLGVSVTNEDSSSSPPPPPAATKTQIDRDIQLQSLRLSFATRIEDSIRDGTFVSLVLHGPKRKKKPKKGKNNPKTTEAASILDNEHLLRGCIKQIQGRRIQLKGQHYLQMTFKYHLATDIVKNWPLTNIMMKDDDDDDDDDDNLQVAFLSILDTMGQTNDNSMDNYIPLSEWGEQEELAGGNPEQQATRAVLGIQKGECVTTSHSIELDVAYSTKKPKLKQSQLTIDTNDDGTVSSSSSPAAAAATIANHDRVKQVPLDTKATFLQALGVTDNNGKPKRAMASKLRQCQKFVEIVGNLVDKATPTTTENSDNTGASICPSIMDMGCGRGYLTFSLHSYLVQKFETVESVGIDIRPKLVTEMNWIASSLGNSFEGVSFKEGSIEELVLDSNNGGVDSDAISATPNTDKKLDILIALHACDTATDDALWCGISRQADIIVVAPCCHKQVRPQLNAHLTNKSKGKGKQDPHPLADMLRHNVYRERHAEMVTDSMRALLLELAGYQVQVFEFIGGEHTAKNVMITAIRLPTPKEGTSQPNQKLLTRLEELAALHGVRQQKLATWMGESFLGENSPLLPSNQAMTSSKKSPRSMPPL